MVFVRKTDDISLLRPLRNSLRVLRCRGIHTVGDFLNAPEGDLAGVPGALDMLRDLTEGNRDYGLPEWGIPIPRSGGKVYWSLDEDGNLTVFGSGRMPDFTAEHPSPWQQLSDNIRTISIEEQVTVVGACAFTGCRNLTRVNLEEQAERIGTRAFAGCTALDEVRSPLPLIHLRDSELPELPERAVFTGMYAFRGTPWAEKTYGDFLVSHDRLLEYHGTATDLVIPEGIHEIGPMVFENMPIRSVIFPETLRRIRQFAFRGTPITELTLPRSLEQIDSWAFGECKELTWVHVQNRTMYADPRAFADSSMDGCALPVNGRWRSMYGINAYDEPGMGIFQCLQAGLSQSHPFGVKNYYPRREFFRCVHRYKLVMCLHLDPKKHLIEGVRAYGRSLRNFYIRITAEPCFLADGTLDISRRERHHLSKKQLLRQDIRGLTRAKKQYNFVWYWSPFDEGFEPMRIRELLLAWLSAHPDYTLPLADPPSRR